jgi:hypothetical protein
MNQQDKVSKVSSKIYEHFINKYPETFVHTGLDTNKIKQIILANKKVNQNVIQKVIAIIDRKIMETTHSNNRTGQPHNTAKFKTDTVTNISHDSYLSGFNPIMTNDNNINNTNKLLEGITGTNADTTVQPNLNIMSTFDQNQVGQENDDPFNENFPLRGRETDMLTEETREFNYFIVLDSKDRNRERNTAPNNFTIEFSPASSDQNAPSNGYVQRGFGNVSDISISDVIILDTSGYSDSSDSSGANYPYLLLNFDEINGDNYGTNDNLNKSFVILKNYVTKGSYKYYNLMGSDGSELMKKKFNPRTNLTRLTTNILLPDGTDFDFGSTATSTANTVVTIMMKVKTIQKNLATQFINKAS